MIQISPQDTFKTLLSFLKSEPLNWFAVPLHCPSLVSKENQDKFLGFAPTIIKVMESGIFYNGGLKGADNPGNGLQYESHPIKDLDQFIYDLAYALYLEVGSTDYPSDFQQYSFSEGMRHLKWFVSLVRWHKGKRAAEQMKKAVSTLETLARNIETKKNLTPNVSKPAIKKQIVDIFLEHIQVPTPRSIMADRAADLLNAFDISATPEGMREYFKNK